MARDDKGDGVVVVLTGTLTGHVPIDHPAFDEGVVDVTPAQLRVGSVEEGQAVAAAIEQEQVRRGVHVLQQADRRLRQAEKDQAVPRGVRTAHDKQLRELADRTGLEV